MTRNSNRRRWIGAACAAWLLPLASCSEPAPLPPVPSAPTSSPATSTPAPAPSPGRSGAAAMTARHLVRTGGIGLRVDYSVDRAAASALAGSLPLRVVVTATAPAGRKVYLSGVTALLAVSDEEGGGHPRSPVSDNANIAPGYFISAPASYSQVFVLPEVPTPATGLSVDLRFEVLVLQARSEPRDFAKATATDHLIVGDL